jgi:hypothetical protein
MFRSFREWVGGRVGHARSDVEAGYRRRIEDYKRPGLVALLGAAQVVGAVALAVVALFLAENTYSKVGLVALCALFGYRGLQLCLRGIATMRLAPLLGGASGDPERSDTVPVAFPRPSSAEHGPPFRPRVVEVDVIARERGDAVLAELPPDTPSVADAVRDVSRLTAWMKDRAGAGKASPSEPATPARRVLMLWVFAHEAPAWLIHIAGELGPVYHLCGGGALDSRGLLSAVFGDRRSQIEETREEVIARLAEFDADVDAEVHTMLCTDSTWKFALDALLERAEVVVMDLTGFGGDNRGATYELQRLVDTTDLRRVVLITGPETDALDDVLGSAWSTMAGDSPNLDPSAGPLVIARLGQLEEDAVSLDGSDESRRALAEMTARISVMRELLDSAARPDATSVP